MNIRKTSIILLAGTIGASSLILSSCSHRHNYGEMRISSPTCIADGFSYHLCDNCGYLECLDSIPTAGHTFTTWKDDIRLLKKVSKCDVCGLYVEENDYEEPLSIPRLYIYGNPNGTEVSVQCRYETTIESDFSGVVRLDANESNDFYKKDYDIEIYTNSTNKTPMELTFTEAMGSSTEYAIKAEYADITSVRNLAASKLWYNVIKSRDNINSGLANLPFYGADYGFPIIFYTNDNFKGIYNFCLPNSGKLFELHSDREALIYTYTAFRKFDFRYDASAETPVPCTVIYPTTDSGKANAQTKFTTFMDFVNSSSKQEFERRISEYLDVDAAIDYLLCVYLFGADKNIAEYCNWVTYNGKQFIPSLYNLTYSFGIDGTGYLKAADSTLAPYTENGVLHSGTSVTLWERLCESFSEKIADRYAYLRENVLNENQIEKVFSEYISMIQPEIYEAELLEYNDKSLFNAPKTSDEIAKWFAEKCAIVDKIFIK